MPPENMEVAQTAAATLVVDHLSKVLGSPSFPPSAIAGALTPFYGVTWNRKVLTSITTNRMNYELGRLRRSSCPAGEYDRLTAFLLQAYLAHGLFPPGAEEWQMLAGRFRLNSSREWGEIASCVPFLGERGVSTPVQLSNLPAEALENLRQGSPAPLIIRSLWSIARTTFCRAASSSFPLPEHKSFSGSHLIRAIARHSAQAARGRKLTVHLSPRLRKLKNFRKVGPCPEDQEDGWGEAYAQHAGQLYTERDPGQSAQTGPRLTPVLGLSFPMLHRFL